MVSSARGYDPGVIPHLQKILLGLAIATAAIRAQPVQIAGINNSLNDFAPFGPSGGICAGSYIDISLSASHLSSGNVNITVTLGQQQLPYFLYSLSNAGGEIYDAQIPWNQPAGTSNLVVTVNNAQSQPYPVTFTSQYCPLAVASSNPNSAGSPDFPFSATSSVSSGAPTDAYTFQTPAAPNDTVFVAMTGLGPTDPSFPVLSYGFSPAMTTPVVTVGTEQAQVLSCNLILTSVVLTPELFELVFKVPGDLAAGNYTVIVSAGGVSSSPLQLAVQPSTSPPRPAIVAASNAASNVMAGSIVGEQVAANTFMSFYVSSLGSITSPPNIFPATSYQGIQVMFNKTPVPIYNITALSSGLTLINVASPQPASPAAAKYSVTVTQSSLASDVYVIPVVPITLGIFSIPDSANPGRRTGAIQFSGTAWDVMPASLATEYGLPACTGLPAASLCGQPAKPGDRIVIYLTGAGLATPNGNPTGQPLASGAVAPADGSVLYQTVATAAVSVAGVSMTVQFSGLVPGTASLYQINATLPAQFSGAFQPGDALPLLLTLTNGLSSSSDQVAIAVSN